MVPDLGSPIIRLARAKVRRGRNLVLRIDDIVVNRGEHLVLLGGNGSGKNLLASLLTGQVGNRLFMLRSISALCPRWMFIL